ncbi:MAG: hypothetical protein ACI9N9_000837 [Enterobacterales bacterium]|jgi:hypothetical protein
MKFIKIIIFLTLFLTPTLVTKPIYSDDFLLLATALCDYTKANDRSKIRKKLKRFKQKIRKVYNGISCNGKTLHQFAKDNNADDVVKFYETKVKANKL